LGTLGWCILLFTLSILSFLLFRYLRRRDSIPTWPTAVALVTEVQSLRGSPVGSSHNSKRQYSAVGGYFLPFFELIIRWSEIWAPARLVSCYSSVRCKSLASPLRTFENKTTHRGEPLSGSPRFSKEWARACLVSRRSTPAIRHNGLGNRCGSVGSCGLVTVVWNLE